MFARNVSFILVGALVLALLTGCGSGGGGSIIGGALGGGGGALIGKKVSGNSDFGTTLGGALGGAGGAWAGHELGDKPRINAEKEDAYHAGRQDQLQADANDPISAKARQDKAETARLNAEIHKRKAANQAAADREKAERELQQLTK